jgi:hypothetical protein
MQAASLQDPHKEQGLGLGPLWLCAVICSMGTLFDQPKVPQEMHLQRILYRKHRRVGLL